MDTKVSIIILNWNGLENTTQCLESLKKTIYPNYEVIVVDNGSTHDDAQVLKERFSDYIHLIENDRNYGFAEGNNIGMRYALNNSRPDYILLLNSDTVVNPEFLTELVKAAETDNRIGSCQSKILSLKDQKFIDAVGIGINKYGCACQMGYAEKDNGQYETMTEVFGACAASALYRTETLKQIGLFDEDFFAYYEDVDLSWRARLFGWKCIYVPTSLVHHIHSATGFSIKAYFLARNEIFYVLKNAPLSNVLLHICRLMLSIPVLMFAGLVGREHKSRFIKLRGKLAALSNIPRMLKKRRGIQSARYIATLYLYGLTELGVLLA